jgi:hypothetical protein
MPILPPCRNGKAFEREPQYLGAKRSVSKELGPLQCRVVEPQPAFIISVFGFGVAQQPSLQPNTSEMEICRKKFHNHQFFILSQRKKERKKQMDSNTKSFAFLSIKDEETTKTIKVFLKKPKVRKTENYKDLKKENCNYLKGISGRAVKVQHTGFIATEDPNSSSSSSCKSSIAGHICPPRSIYRSQSTNLLLRKTPQPFSFPSVQK